MVKPLFLKKLRGNILPKKSVFTRLFGVFRNLITMGRCLAPKARALPTALHPDYLILIYFLQLSAALPVATKTLTSPRLVNRQVAATPYCSLHHPQGALANVPNCATSRKNISATFDIITDLFLSVKCLYIVFLFY